MDERGYVCRTEVTAVPALKAECVWQYSSSSIHRSYPIFCKRKENARVKFAVRWRSVDFVEVARDYVALKTYGSVPRRTIKEVAVRNSLDKRLYIAVSDTIEESVIAKDLCATL
jgi:hypothetical protein